MRVKVYMSQHFLLVRWHGPQPNNLYTNWTVCSLSPSETDSNSLHTIEIELFVFDGCCTHWQESQDCVAWNEAVFPVSAVHQQMLSITVRRLKHGLNDHNFKH